mmetsp:Transcript_3114/g.4778  ORF Transcript_3114/g.4778 Transcript_3114/m.4778 type:complete len:161 (+) Transcript_3114:131-613(+)
MRHADSGCCCCCCYEYHSIIPILVSLSLLLLLSLVLLLKRITNTTAGFGTPTDEQWPSMKDLPDFKKISFPVMQPTPPHKLLPSASKTALQLIRRLLAYDPDDRVAAHLALQERYFYSEPWPVHHLKLRGTIAAVQQLAAEKRNAVFEIDAPFNLEGLLG